MSSDVRDRFVLPILVPVGILVVFVGAAFGLSRLMLSVPGFIATTIALVLTAAIVAFVALRGRQAATSRRPGLPVAVGVIVLGIVGGGLGLIFGPRASLAALLEEELVEGATWTAIDTDYTSAPIELSAGETELVLQNEGGLRHSIAIDDLGGQLVLAGGGETVSEVHVLPIGTFTYYCDIADHRDRGMIGELIVTN